MANAFDTTSPHRVRASKRLRKTAAVTAVAATDLFTVPAGFLDDLQPGDIVTFESLTGGAGLTPGQEYFLCNPRFTAGQTTCKVSTIPFGAPLDVTSDLTVGTVITGRLTLADDGVQSGNHVPYNSPRGGGLGDR